MSLNCKSRNFIVALHSFPSRKHHNYIIASEAAPKSFHMHLWCGTSLMLHAQIRLDPRIKMFNSHYGNILAILVLVSALQRHCENLALSDLTKQNRAFEINCSPVVGFRF